jgi:hypothetical protein
MKRFAIEIVRGNDTRILGTYDTKEQGQEVGRSYAQALAREGGLVTLIYADFNEHNKRTSNECRIFDIWDIQKEA